MNKSFDFTSLAPYQDRDVRPVLNELKKHDAFMAMLRFADMQASREELLQLVNGLDTIHDFQRQIVRPWLRYFFSESIDELTYDGIDQLDNDQKHLFISNHRDIILDSGILNVLLDENGLDTVETAIGDNLLKSGLVRAVAKLNKIFTVIRDAPRREMYEHSQLLSAYIRDRVTTGKTSVWLAQREGRAKDGNDITQQGLIKMLNLSNTEDFETGFKALRIHPMSLSYEYDPCDLYEVREMLAKEEGRIYQKREDEDYQNIEAGIRQYKGRVHLSIQPELEGIDQLKSIQNVNGKASGLAAMIDQSIYRSYKLFDNNYVAHDLLHGKENWKDHYSKEKKEEFQHYVEGVVKGQPSKARAILLKKYAFPLINQRSLEG